MSKPRVGPSFGISLGDVLILPKRHPACRRREARLGSSTERENLAGDVKAKAQAAPTARPKVPMRRRGADCLVVMKALYWSWSEGGGPPRLIWANRLAGMSPLFNGRRQPSCGGMSRISREAYVRICERLRVKFPGADSANASSADSG